METNITELVFILDRSGSMAGLENDTIGGFNAMLAKQQVESGECRITTALFNHDYELLHDRLDIRTVRPVTENEYQVGGTTALLDAIGRTIHNIGNAQKLSEPERRADKVLFVITTDGMENASRKYSYEHIEKMIERQKGKYGWEFIFLGANIDAVKVAGRFGIAADRAQNYHADREGVRLSYEITGRVMTDFRAKRKISPCWNAEIEADYRGRFSRAASPVYTLLKGKTLMLGAITGDIVGSVYEFDNIKTKDFQFFSSRSYFTDDAVMTIAVAEALMHGGRESDFTTAMRKFGRLYPHAGYGESFKKWLVSETPVPYGSWGNGSAMRVSPCGWFASSLEEAESLAARSAAVTHDHPEGIKGAQATAAAVYLARNGKSKAEIKAYIENTYGYDLNRTIDEIRPAYSFDVSCQGTVPEAVIAFLESSGFEDALRNAVSLGGDSDTLAAITGSVAEAAYGIPDWIKEKALGILDERLRGVYAAFMDRIS